MAEEQKSEKPEEVGEEIEVVLGKHNFLISINKIE
jgi:hypothetical protein